MPSLKKKPAPISEAQARDLVCRVAEEVTDPQTGLTAQELGFLQETKLEGPRIAISVFPTHPDCPSMNLLTMNLECRIEDEFALPHVRTIFDPWDSSRMTETGKAKLRRAFARYGKGWRCVCGRPFAEFMKV